MNKKLIYIVAIGIEVEEPVKLAWEFYCNKYNIDFKIITDSSLKEMAPHWERYFIFGRFPDYEQYIYVDADAMVRWDTPDLFRLLKGENFISPNVFYAVKDIGSLEWTYNSIKGYQDLFPNTILNWWEYFTTGFLKFDQTHKEFFKYITDFYKENMETLNERSYKTLRKGFDQTPVNYLVREFEGLPLKILPEVYSLGHLHKKDIFQNGMFLNIPSYIWQFNGMPKDALKNVIDQVWQHIKDKYE